MIHIIYFPFVIFEFGNVFRPREYWTFLPAQGFNISRLHFGNQRSLFRALQLTLAFLHHSRNKNNKLYITVTVLELAFSNFFVDASADTSLTFLHFLGLATDQSEKYSTQNPVPGGAKSVVMAEIVLHFSFHASFRQKHLKFQVQVLL